MEKLLNELKRKNSELENLLDFIPGLVFYKDTKNNFIKVNKYTADGYKTTKENLEGKNLTEIHAKEDAEKYYLDDLTVIESGKPKLDIEEKWDTPSGEAWVSTSKIPVYDNDNNIIGILGLSFDITNRKKMQNQLNDLYQLNSKIINESPIGIFACSEDGPCVYANQAVADISGATLETMLGLNFRNLKTWQQNGLLNKVEIALATDKKQKADVHIISSFGRDIWINYTITTFKLNEKKHFLMIVEDISELKNAELSILNSNKILESIHKIYKEKLSCKNYYEVSMLCLETAIALTDSAFGFIGELNNSGTFDTTAITNPGWDNCRMPKDNSTRLILNMKIKGLWGNVVKTGSPLLTNDPSNHPDSTGVPDGHPAITSFLGIPLFRDGKTIGIIALANKKSGFSNNDLKNMEILSGTISEALKRMKDEFYLHKILNDLEESNKKLDDFAYIASHDLKEPLRAVSNYSSYLKEDYADKIDDEGKRFIDTIIRQAERMENQINTLLRFSRIGRGKIEHEIINTNNLVQNIIESRPKDNDVEIIIDKTLPDMMCNEIFIEEIFTNLISNAIKYNENQKKVINIGVKDSPEQNFNIFYVKDNGIGIDKKHHDNIFKIFKRLHGRDEYNGGTGAGLTITKKLIEVLNGKIWLESETGKGTTFYFTIGETK